MKETHRVKKRRSARATRKRPTRGIVANSAPPPEPEIEKFAKAEVQDTEKWVHIYRYRREDGQICFAAIAASLASIPKHVLSSLSETGLAGTTHPSVRDIVSEAAHSNPARLGTVLLRGGWIGAPGNVFALNTRIIRGSQNAACDRDYFPAPNFDLNSRAQPVSYKGSWAPSHLELGVNGSAKQWKREVGTRALSSSTMMLAISASVAAPFLRLMNEPPFGILITGPSSGGKTTLTLASASFNGIGKQQQLANWNSTAAGLAQEVEIHNDLCFPIDDIKNFSGSDREIYKLMSEVAYRVTHGMRKMAHREAVKRISGRPAVTRGVSTILLTSAEMGFDQLAKAAGEKELPEGVGVRFIEVPILSREIGGIFDRKGVAGTREKQMEYRAALADQIMRSCDANHGWPLIKLLESVVRNSARAVNALKRYRALFISNAEFDRKDSYQLRHAQRFAFLFAASAYAIDRKLLPWTHDQLESAIQKCHQDSRAILDGRKPRRTPDDLLRNGLGHLKQAIRGPGRFVALSDPGPPTGVAGWKQQAIDRKVYYIRGEVWRRGIFKSSEQRKQVEQHLIRTGVLRTGPEGIVTVQPRLGKSRKRTERCYELSFRTKRQKSSAKRQLK